MSRAVGWLAAILLLMFGGVGVIAQESDAPGAWTDTSLGQSAASDKTADFDFDGALDAAGADELLDAVPDETRGLMEQGGIEGIDYKQMLQLSPSDFFAQLWELVCTRVKRPLRTFGALVGAVLLCAMLGGMKTTVGEGALSGVFSAVSVLCAAGALAAPVVDCIASTVRTLQDCSNLMAAFIPVFSSIVAAGGQPAAAGGYAATLFLACQVVSHIASNTLAPLMGLYLAFCICGNIVEGARLSAVARVVRQIVNWSLGLIVTIFVALLSMQTLVASGSDAVVSKTAKFLIGSFVPVVGSALSDAFVAAQGYMRLLKTTVGAFGVLAALLTVLPVFLQTVIWYFIVNLSAAVGELLDAKELSEILTSAASTLGILIAVQLCFALLFIVSTSIMLICATGVA